MMSGRAMPAKIPYILKESAWDSPNIRRRCGIRYSFDASEKCDKKTVKSHRKSCDRYFLHDREDFYSGKIIFESSESNTDIKEREKSSNKFRAERSSDSNSSIYRNTTGNCNLTEKPGASNAYKLFQELREGRKFCFSKCETVTVCTAVQRCKWKTNKGFLSEAQWKIP